MDQRDRLRLDIQSANSYGDGSELCLLGNDYVGKWSEYPPSRLCAPSLILAK